MTHKKILAIYPSYVGFSFAFFHGLDLPVEWGVREVVRNKNDETFRKIQTLLDWSKPDVVVVRNCSDKLSKKYKRIRVLIRRIVKLVRDRDIEQFTYTRSEIRKCFGRMGAKTKQDIVHAIAARTPEFSGDVTAPKRIWEKEDYRMGIYDAVALVYTFCHGNEGCGGAPEDLPAIAY